ncbi:Down syndrome cell adhesion molecule protein Dscam2-like [Tropilaelaps mercedesae]|uniref:Down syndrome cell adhesion molecule protein Dscam2-like n=1 Tax=Tropilaelaps mercedesae TaxID=418985 RepID=A0A1V9X503_9ACAR|nr:Down syndrome cell adhesion molecule protein Dscam2-like [Tropilaelaps mercedesae]
MDATFVRARDRAQGTQIDNAEKLESLNTRRRTSGLNSGGLFSELNRPCRITSGRCERPIVATIVDVEQANAAFCSVAVPEEPEDIKALVLAPDAIVVSWRPPRRPNGLVQTYTVYGKLTDSSSQESFRRVSVPSGQLYHEMRNLRSGQRYEFWVTAATSVGEGPPSKRAVQTPDIKAAARVASFSRGVSVVQKQDIELDCRVAGLPLPQRTWKVNDRVIPSGSPRIKFLGTGAIRIESVKESDAANYSCHVTNSYGKDHVDYALTIASDPSTVRRSPNSLIRLRSS